jgi:hypothetical protein
MAVQSVKDRFYPKHPVGKGNQVDPELLNQHQRLAFDHIYDAQAALQQMTGGATGLALFAAGAVTAVLVMFPGFGYTAPPLVTITGGGGAGAKAVATIKQGRVSAITVTAGGAGYTATPIVTIVP